MEPSGPWCPTCYSEIEPRALRCQHCGTAFQGRFKREPIAIQPIRVSYGPSGQLVDETGFASFAGVAINFHSPTFPDEGQP
jgi:hypothetical protein